MLGFIIFKISIYIINSLKTKILGKKEDIKNAHRLNENIKEENMENQEEIAKYADTEIKKYEKDYSEEGFWDKVLNFAKQAGGNVIYIALILYYLATESDVPIRVKTIILGALGYFILPIDLIPDVIPIIGYVDDAGILLAALLMAAAYITPEIKEKARLKLSEWFGDDDIDTVVAGIDNKLNPKK